MAFHNRIFLITVFHTILSCYAQKVSFNAEEIFAKVNPSVLTVYVMAGNQNIAQGSGVVLNDSGWVVTNYSLFKGGDRIIIKHGEKIYGNVDLIGVDEHKDVLLLYIREAYFPPLAFGKIDSIKVGQKVYAIGSPLGFENTLSEGIISGIRFGNIASTRDGKNLIQTTAPISSGSSGGALVNSRGELIGISSLFLKGGQNLNFAVPVSDVMQVYPVHYRNPEEIWYFNCVQKAKSLFDTEKFEKAILYYEKILEKSPQDLTALTQLGETYRNLGNYENAIRTLQFALTVDPSFIPAYLSIGKTHTDMQNPYAAIKFFKHALQLEPESSPAFSGLAQAYSRTGEYDEAIKYYNYSLERDSVNFVTLNNLGGVYTAKQCYDAAIEYYKKSLSYNPGYGVASGNLADAYMQKGDYEEAVKILTQVLEKGAREWNIYYNLAESYYMLGIYEKAMRFFFKVLEDKGKVKHPFALAGTYFFLSMIYKAKGDKSKMKEYREKAYQLQEGWKKMKEKEIIALIK